MTNKQPMQADGSGTSPAGRPDEGEVASRRGGPDQTGESGGGAYPNPHTGKDGSKNGPDRFMGRGGQTEQAYHGHGQLGDDTQEANENAPSRQR